MTRAKRKGLLPLTDEQRRAVDPGVHAWVSASAGTGKTQVLSARVLRLLVGEARPDGILALTFTKAAAAEMQTRIFETLSRWVTADDEDIVTDLRNIAAEPDAAMIRRARMLFAQALEVRGGFKVQTLHGFASSLLAAFPVEAGVTPGYDTLDDRSGAQLKRQVLEDAIEDAADAGAQDFLDDLGALAIRHGDQRATQILGQLLRERRALLALGGGGAVDAAVRRILNLPVEGSAEDILRGAIDADAALLPAMRGWADALANWNTKTAAAKLEAVTPFVFGDVEDRVAQLKPLLATLFREGGEGDAYVSNKKLEPAQKMATARAEILRDTLWRLELAEAAALHLRVGRVIAARYDEAKQRLGALDYDDLIVEAASLLQRVAAPWVLYKLDQRIDHVLVDEGQDTNASQWQIVHGLASEFFAGTGAKDEGARTQFAVGDFKQAIFGFQGTDPLEFTDARALTAARGRDAGSPLHEIGLNRSFRSVPAVLTVVDRLLGRLGHEAFGVDRPFKPHVPHRNAAGAVTLWPPLSDDDGRIPEGFRQNPERELARRIAAQVDEWITRELFVPSRARAVQPQDILILVRSRGDLVPELVAALHAAEVPVAGADRLRLTAPIAVQDCLSLIRFALQPDDDLTLAELLVSPFIGWSQEDMAALAMPRGDMSLWQALKRADGEAAQAARTWLDAVLAMADFRTPYDMLEAVFSGPLRGRAKLLARLGPEARDPLEELLSQALAYERVAAPSLQGFLDWLAAAADIYIKRDPDAPSAAVRIMTVHGAKGLQAPVVIMADAARTHGERHGVTHLMAGNPELPLYGLSTKTLPAMLRKNYEDRAAREAEENLRLLYVAMTRAEDYLFVGGLPAGRATVTTWYDLIRDAMADVETEEEQAPIWDGVSLRHKSGTEAKPRARTDPSASEPPVTLPVW
ncbi:MAG: UvrD-helicase domain-containing protein, partial [Pacificimonas sp.]